MENLMKRKIQSGILLLALLVAPITLTANASAYQAVADGGGGDVRTTTSFSSTLETIKAVAQSINAAGAGQLAVVASLTFNAIRSVGVVGTVVLVLGF